jgi:nucleoside-diphosphate-sugar epimerase
MRRIAVTGAASFIGQHLVRHLSTHGNAEVRILIHENKPKHVMDIKGIMPVEGDLLKPDTLGALFEPGCAVINLAYLNHSSFRENLAAMENLIENCLEARIKRLVHCSTAVVVGGVPDDVITEVTPCDPNNEYETTKLHIEELLKEKARGHFELAILRPTAVFGPGGKNLLKLASDLTTGSGFVSYAKSCLLGSRRMNLVYVDNVVFALLFLVFTDQRMDREIFIISDDEYLENNYRDIEKYLIKELGRKEYPLPRIPLPQLLLSNVLKLVGRSNSNPNRIYQSDKIKSIGFQKKTSFETGLTSFTEWYKKTYLPPKQKI